MISFQGLCCVDVHSIPNCPKEESEFHQVVHGCSEAERHVIAWVREPAPVARADARQWNLGRAAAADNIQSYRSLTNFTTSIRAIVTVAICTPFAALIMRNMFW